MQRTLNRVITVIAPGNFIAKHVTIRARLPVAVAAVQAEANVKVIRILETVAITAITPVAVVTETEKDVAAMGKLLKVYAETVVAQENCVVWFVTAFPAGIPARDVTAEENKSVRVQTARIQKQ